MARVSMDGADAFINILEDVMDIPDNVVMAMLNAEADVVVRAQKEAVENSGLVDTKQLRDSISRTNKLEAKGMEKYIEVYPQGVRKDGIRNAEVGFINEYGAPHRHIKAAGWMEKANEKSADAAIDKAADVYDDYLRSKNL